MCERRLLGTAGWLGSVPVKERDEKISIRLWFHFAELRKPLGSVPVKERCINIHQFVIPFYKARKTLEALG